MEDPENTIEETEEDVVQAEEQDGVETATEENAQEAPTQEVPAQPKMWFDDLPEGIRDNPNVTKHKSVESISKAYIESVRKLGEKGSLPPPADATPEQIAATNAIRRGSIKSPNDYSFEKGSEDVDVIDVKQALFDAGADDYMANQVFSRLKSQWNQEAAQLRARFDATCKQENDKLISEWQEDYAVNMKANEMMLNSRYQEAQKILADTGADRFASVQLMLRDLNARAGDAQIRFDEAKHETFSDQVRRIQDSVAYKNEFHPKHLEAVRKLGRLFQQEALKNGSKE